ncbi:hypothetical protein F383_16789 [Gossypium arboreum]|uniref:Uncharacterized protein n=1 Tax=Gossypium arboreum TaxID=29729 RepID=A0A0B0NVT6_GOSAR|nr:hypothetical protein F383_16789 [Gossypium arboreum]
MFQTCFPVPQNMVRPIRTYTFIKQFECFIKLNGLSFLGFSVPCNEMIQ